MVQQWFDNPTALPAKGAAVAPINISMVEDGEFYRQPGECEDPSEKQERGTQGNRADVFPS